MIFHRTSIPYLAWKTDEIEEASNIYIRQVEEDGYTFVEGSVATKIMTADQPSDEYIVEGMKVFNKCAVHWQVMIFLTDLRPMDLLSRAFLLLGILWEHLYFFILPLNSGKINKCGRTL